jgi:hypothetical protein
MQWRNAQHVAGGPGFARIKRALIVVAQTLVGIAVGIGY